MWAIRALCTFYNWQPGRFSTFPHPKPFSYHTAETQPPLPKANTHLSHLRAPVDPSAGLGWTSLTQRTFFWLPKPGLIRPHPTQWAPHMGYLKYIKLMVAVLRCGTTKALGGGLRVHVCVCAHACTCTCARVFSNHPVSSGRKGALVISVFRMPGQAGYL